MMACHSTTVMESAKLERVVSQCCQAIGADPEIADSVAQHLVRADLSGHPSHGVARLPGYVALADTGELVPSAHPTIVSESPGAALFDAHRGFGQFSTRVALDWAIDTAERIGIALALIRHSQHIGRLGEYAERAAERGAVSIVTVGMAGDGVGAVVAPGTARRFLGANPWTMGVPASDGEHVIVDMSTAVVAEGKIHVQAARGEQLPEGWAVDRRGNPTTDPAAYLDGGGLLPLGSPGAAHKGFGLGLAAALFGSLAVVGDDDLTMIGASVAAGADPGGRTAGVAVIAIAPWVVAGANGYPAMVTDTLAALHRVAPGAVVPGGPERASRHGSNERVDLPAATAAELRSLALRLGVDAGGLGD